MRAHRDAGPRRGAHVAVDILLSPNLLWLCVLLMCAVIAILVGPQRRKPITAGEAAPVPAVPPTHDPMIALLRGRLFDFENGSGDDEKDQTVAIVLTSGHRYGLVSIAEIDFDDAIVRVHDLQRNGRRLYIRISDISAIEGSEDE